MSKLRINLGSGQRPFKGWVNVDTQAKWNPEVVADGSSLPMFEDGCAEYVVLHHVLEHFGCGEGLGMLRECYRILEPGGSLIVTVPDMKEVVRGWATGRLSTQLFLTNIYGAYMGDEADRHKWGFTLGSLIKEIGSAGDWQDLKGFDYRSIEGTDIAKDWWILGVEAIR